MNVTCGEEPFEHTDWKALFDKKGNVAGVASEDFIQTMLQHPKVIEAFGNEVSDKFVAYCTPEFYEKFVKRVTKLEVLNKSRRKGLRSLSLYTQHYLGDGENELEI